MKKALKITSITVMALIALAGCNGPTNTSNTQGTSSTNNSSTPSETKSNGEMKKVTTPGDVQNLNEVEAMGNKVTTYNVKMDAQAAFDAQAKLIKDAGWNGSYQGMTSPISAGGSVTQTFAGGKKILVLAVTADPINAGMTLVTMTESADPLAQ